MPDVGITPRSRSARHSCGSGHAGPARAASPRGAVKSPQPSIPRAWDRIGVLPPVLLELALALPQPPLPPLVARDDPLRVKLKRHLLARPWLGLRDPLRPLPGSAPAAPVGPPRGRTRAGPPGCAAPPAAHQPAHPRGSCPRPDLWPWSACDDLPGDLLKLVVRLRAGVPRDPGAIDRHHPGLDQPRPVTQLEHLAEQARQRLLMPTDEPGDRHMIRHQVAGDHPVGNVLPTVTLDRPRGPHTRRERVQDQRHHQRRLIRSTTMTIRPVGGIERR